MDITVPEALSIIGVISVPSMISYALGRRFSPAWLGLVLSLAWLPLLFIACPPAARATVFGAILLSFIPVVLAFTVGVARRPRKLNR